MIDFHVHIGNLYRATYPNKIGLSVHQLIERMNREGIKISVLLPLESPEGANGYFLTEEAISARDMYPERLIAFMCVDPRMPDYLSLIDVFVKVYGCKGLGEHINSLAFDDPRNKAIYAKCDEYGLPIDFEINTNYCYDEVGLPRLEACLKEFKNVKWCGHGPGFWSAISGDDPRGGYPPEKIKPNGALDRLLTEYDNLYADISAGSGYNGLTRDPEFIIGFVQRHWRKLLFGSDYMGHNQPIPQVEWLKSIDITPEMRYAIAEGNARKVLGLD
ncbi:MAG: amidohydrolase family protein [Candidatus Poribacteria bacterium]